jgi:hypothetical protein
MAGPCMALSQRAGSRGYGFGRGGEKRKNRLNRYVVFWCIMGFGGRAKPVKENPIKRIFGGLKAYLRATNHTCSNIISRDIPNKF